MAEDLDVPLTPEALVAPYRPLVLEWSPLSLVAKQEHCWLVDVREPEEVLLGFLPEAINIPRGLLEFALPERLKGPPFSRPLVLYSSRGYRSTLAAYSLMTLGYGEVASLQGGMHQWQALGLPVH
ncbi:MAG: rhodanese-like domain-containing protein [Candidatus Competibacterales bacterium]